jgi:hypothetical protein
METFYATEAVENLRKFATLLERLSPPDAKFLTGLLTHVEQGSKFRLPDAGDLLGTDRAKRTFRRDDLDFLHMPYPVTILEYGFAAERHDMKVAEQVISTRRLTLVFDVPAGANKIPLYQRWVDEIPAFQEQGGVIIAGLWANHGEATDFPNGADPCLWESSISAMVIPRNQLLPLRETGPGFFGLMVGEIQVYYPMVMSFLYRHAVSSHGADRAVELAVSDLAEDLHVAFDFMLALSCNNVTSAPAEGESREKLNKKRREKNKVPFFEYKQLMIAGAKLDANLPAGASAGGSSPGRDGMRSTPRMHLRRGHVRTLGPGRRTWVNFAVVGAAEKGRIAKDYIVAAVSPTSRRP